MRGGAAVMWGKVTLGGLVKVGVVGGAVAWYVVTFHMDTLSRLTWLGVKP